MKAWKDGQLIECSPTEFTASLRRHAGWADQEFGIRSDAAAHLGERLTAAAAEIERLREQLWLAREDMAHLVQQIDTVLGQETPK